MSHMLVGKHPDVRVRVRAGSCSIPPGTPAVLQALWEEAERSQQTSHSRVLDRLGRRVFHVVGVG